jgi:2-polyprenyl-3-methyl-5-hydroxy-6-metoxy-1,4-benzoquinol methylase
MKIILDYMRGLLDSAYIFNLFEKLAGTGGARRRFVNDFIIPFDNAFILDIGCGTGAIIDHLPEKVNYVGFDLSFKYIDYAKDKYKTKGEFYCEDINLNISDLQLNTFDFVISIGVVHHLNNAEVEILLNKAKKYLKPGGKLITMDPVYVQNQYKISKFMMDNDRGDYIRNISGYKALFSEVFDKTDDCVVDNMLIYPYNHYITNSTK